MQAFTFDAMNRSKPAARAAIFDMDGVVTDTAGVHAEAWRQMFDAVLPQLTDGEARPFDPSDEYRRLVDGRSREDGVRAVLTERGLTAVRSAWGDPLIRRHVGQCMAWPTASKSSSSSYWHAAEFVHSHRQSCC